MLFGDCLQIDAVQAQTDRSIGASCQGKPPPPPPRKKSCRRKTRVVQGEAKPGTVCEDNGKISQENSGRKLRIFN